MLGPFGQIWFVRKTAIHSLYVILLLTPVTKLDIIDVMAHHTLDVKLGDVLGVFMHYSSFGSMEHL